VIDPWIAVELKLSRLFLDSIFSEPRVPYPYPQLTRSRIRLASPVGWGDSGPASQTDFLAA